MLRLRLMSTRHLIPVEINVDVDVFLASACIDRIRPFTTVANFIGCHVVRCHRLGTVVTRHYRPTFSEETTYTCTRCDRTVAWNACSDLCSSQAKQRRLVLASVDYCVGLIELLVFVSFFYSSWLLYCDGLIELLVLVISVRRTIGSKRRNVTKQSL